MKSRAEEELINESLAPDALAGSLLATRRAAAGKRTRRRLARGAVLAAVCAGALWQWASGENRGGAETGSRREISTATEPQPGSRAAPVLAPRPPAPAKKQAPFVLVTTGSQPKLKTVTTSAQRGVVIVRTDGKSQVAFSTSAGAGARPTPRITEEDLFAMAGRSSAALHHLPDGTARWMWIKAE